jgi:membrane associated rhomboid family serine protease
MNQVQFQAPPLTKINKIVLISAGLTFLLHSILKAVGAFSLVQYLGLSGSGLFHGLIYQLFTYGLVETQLMSLIFSGMIVWFIGSELESLWGSRVYLRFLLLTLVGVGLIYSLVSLIFFYGTRIYATPLHGLAGINFALLTAYAVLYPDRQMSLMMIFPVRARTFCLILGGIEAYMAIFTDFSSAWAHLLAMGISYLIIRFQSHSLLKKVLNSTFSARKPKSASKKHLYVVKDEEQNPPKYWQ